MFDYIIVGAGFAGCVIANKIATELNKKVLIIEKRHHIGGNCYDYMNKHGILVHKYGPHLFHTNNKEVVDYLSQFTQWEPYEHKVLANIDGTEVPLPFNLNTIDSLFPPTLAKKYEEVLLKHFTYNTKVPILELMKSKDPLLSELADYIYQKVFFNYTTKQWGISPEEIDSSVTSRVPIFIGRDNRYFNDQYQMLPKEGYTTLFSNMIKNPNIKLMLNTDCKEVINLDNAEDKINFLGAPYTGKLIFTGRIDDLFSYDLGELPYRSINFEFETLPIQQYQTATTINYPNNYEFTRITEFKHMQTSKSKSTSTTIVKEYPTSYNKDVDVPYYPVFTPHNQKLYSKYNLMTSKYKNLFTIGRLAEYKYYDMDDVIEAAIKFFNEEIK